MTAELDLRPATESDRTYIARLNYLADVFGKESAPLSESFAQDYDYYVSTWRPGDGGVIAWRELVPAGGVWLLWGTAQRHGYGHVAEGIPELALAVEERFKGQGLGTVLLDAAANLARQMGAPGISLSVAHSNSRADRLYRHVGFEQVDDAAGHYVLLKQWG
ncbi:GNAT family N-acetyltransferase [Corynebacterium lizhenjunii]|uniref:GNAT family N-acetyltransferase n=1 Tax=Corynebacterium lizhenjunii TaxID=2709394 RepID=A0A7T0PC04_9CORY|nr:N-acetyltransferase [Corynebacterium lizhenjunii]QPK79187.1 GNAT family N-acetyltransferase [Corynebacterium lizhenjunii]